MDESHPPGKLSLETAPNQNDVFARLLARTPVNLLLSLLREGDPHLVGGAVRDAILGAESSDIDIATRYRPEECEKILTRAGLRVIETGLKHGTITVVVEDENIEITTFRHPTGSNESEFAKTIEEDLRGRDFTINAIAFSLVRSQLVDPFNGQGDLAGNILRAVENAEERFSEDPLRMLRAIRFGPAAGRTLEDSIRSAIPKLRSRLTTVSPERIRVEFCKILCANFSSQGLRDMHLLGLLELIVPEAIPSIGFEQNEFHVHDVFEHTLWVLERTPKEDLTLRLAAFFHDLGKPATFSLGEDGRRHFYQHEQVSTDICIQVMRRLRFSNKEIEDVSRIVRYHMRPIDCGPPGLRRLMRDLGDNFSHWRRFKWADSPPVLGEEDFDSRAARFDALVEQEKKRQAEAKLNRLAIDGEDIKQFGIPEGRRIGEVLRHLTELILDDPELNSREILLERARHFLGI